MTLTVAIAGRPNVGKSTLFNRLTKRKSAIVHDTPGVTRDWREGTAMFGDLPFTLLDTAGLEDETESLTGRMSQQSLRAIGRADVILFVLDGRAGITPVDETVASQLRKTGQPVIVVVNKAEGNAADATAFEVPRLGFGEAVLISAEHGVGITDIYEMLRANLEEKGEQAQGEAPEKTLHIAVIGRPNAGKSTLANAFAGYERMLTGPEAGITRDAITIPLEHAGRKIELLDTAGMRRKANIVEPLERMAVGDSLQAIRFAEVVIMMIDANQPLEKQDNVLLSMVAREGRALVLAVNKWDTIKDKDAYLKSIRERAEDVLSEVKQLHIVPISALKKDNLEKLWQAVFMVYATWNKRVSTAKLNDWLEEALERHTPPLVKNRRIKIRYMTQTKARPPTFALFANVDSLPEDYLRYLSNSLREIFSYPGVPLRLRVKKGKNPYEEKKKK